ncbi:MAG TPA: tetratricopeptide repeat protein [Polyangiaceae bacterium]|jgi:Flp pilus assembly protein TadD
MGKRAESDDVDTLRRNVEWALRNAVDADEVLPMLAKLARSAEPESDAWVLAHRHLAELAVDRDPWRSAIFARRVVKVDPDDDGAWAVLGLAQTLLGNYRYAAASYRRAIALSPHNPWYAHNLGHLLDVALGRPQDAIALLAEAHKREPKENEIAASYAHALARAGRLGQAKKVLRRVVAKGATAEQMILWRWLEQGAPQTKSTPSGPASPPRRPRAKRRARQAEQPDRRS